MPERYPQNQSAYADERKDGQQAEISKRREGNKEGNMRYDVLSGYGENTRYGEASGYADSSKYSGASLYEEPEVIHKTRRKDRNVSKEDFLQNREKRIREKTTAEKLKKKVQ